MGKWLKRIIGFFVIAYLFLLLLILIILRYFGDEWWLSSLLLYGPRNLYWLPWLIFLPLTFLWNRKLILPVGISGFVLLFPILGFNIPFEKLLKGDQPAAFRVLTYNIQRWSVSALEFSELLDRLRPDFAAVQECAPSRWQLPSEWHIQRSQSTIVVSRYPIIRTEISHRKPDVNGLYCVIDTPNGLIGFCCVDLLTPRRALTKVLDPERILKFEEADGAQRKIEDRWKESEALSDWLKRFPGPKIIAGDFNLTIDSPIYRTYWSGYGNAFSQSGFGFGHTKYTKINIFKYHSRIDHVLTTPHFRAVNCFVGPDFGSDHLPLVADLVRN